MDRQQELQEQAYAFPYHYLPRFENGVFSQHEYWSWGYRYLGRLQVVFDILDGEGFDSLLDIGCGDGRFLREAYQRYGDKKLLGIDYSETAISLARMLNPHMRFEHRDLLAAPIPGEYDVVTLLEVIEHLPPDSLPNFLEAVNGLLRPGGRLILTTAHTNAALDPKHYQHFTQARLHELLQDHFADFSFIPFDHIPRWFRLAMKLMGGTGKHFIITNRWLITALFTYYMRHCLYGKGEPHCQRIACTARKRING
jgi:SAM-dependent methyltransferase